MMTQIFAQSCVLTFLAEWGDRSQISTIILAARDVSSDDNETVSESVYDTIQSLTWIEKLSVVSLI